MDYGASCEISIAFQNNNEFSTHHYVFGYEGYEFAERPIYKRKQKEWDTMFELINGKQFVSNLTQGEIIFLSFSCSAKRFAARHKGKNDEGFEEHNGDAELDDSRRENLVEELIEEDSQESIATRMANTLQTQTKNQGLPKRSRLRVFSSSLEEEIGTCI